MNAFEATVFIVGIPLIAFMSIVNGLNIEDTRNESIKIRGCLERIEKSLGTTATQ